MMEVKKMKKSKKEIHLNGSLAPSSYHRPGRTRTRWREDISHQPGAGDL